MYELREAFVEEAISYKQQEAFNKIVEDKLIAIFDKPTETLRITWRGEVSSNEFRNGYLKIAKLIRTYKPSKWLLNLRDRSPVSGEDKRWIFQYFFPKALRIVGQNIYMAVILPVYAYPSLIHNLEGDELIYKDNLMIIEHFLFQEESMKWLKNVER